ncbi:uncharacterized protein I303_101344 [Kwoniella dejecticola CBS 10117]|uniref:Zn(2)-C6 fungal-type domain-containing protein n=1 Tax=Kwoniella dejecticola CBS 10117 TaxID=1296121 RepID=A0A1A6AHH3_9TREE|nr:uncharacterized protein I303_01353 [Kwoniella dejecticola CBS 10117]OBR89525.1 hypothetical protein I303_01353 [Kwoniella dejecticola CBS 10117]
MAEAPTAAGPSFTRAPRSRLDRPCDLCRRLKQLCSIEVRGEPCMACRVRFKPCTFDMPPSVRKRRKKESPSHAVQSQRAPILDTCDQHPSRSSVSHDLHPSAPSLSIGTSSMRDDNGVGQIPWTVNSEHIEEDIPPSSLDMEEPHDEESHFLGADAFSTLVVKATDLSTTSQTPGGLSFRQVSSDTRFPVYFVKTPALIYGRTPHNGQAALEANQKMGEKRCSNLLPRIFGSVRAHTLKAIPIINPKRLDATYSADAPGPGISPALLAGIIAHSTHYIPALRGIHKELWSNALLALDDEFRQPRLATLQLALLQMYSRPMEIAENAGQLTIGSGRALGAAFLLGLHIDSTNWSLPLWERKLRKRIWWALVIQDKWRALLYGRPSFLHKGSYNVPLLSVEDGDYGEDASTPDRTSMESFIATSRLTLLIDDIIDNFQSISEVGSKQTPAPVSRIAQLELSIERIQEIRQEYLPIFGVSQHAERGAITAPTGVRSFQLSSLGLTVLIRRLLLRTIPDTPYNKIQSLSAIVDALQTCREVTNFVECLTPGDEELYWTPYAFHHIFNVLSLLLYIITRARSLNHEIIGQTTELTIGYVSTMIAKYRRTQWDVIAAALRRAVVLLMCVKQDLPEFNQSYIDVATALNLPTFVTDLSVDDFLASLGIDVPAAWSQVMDDQTWLSSVGFNNDLGV